MKDSPRQMGSLCTRSAEPVSPPFGQRNCPEMDSCAQGRAYRKWNHTQYLWLPRGLATHWPGHPAADRQTVGCPKFFTRSATIHHSFRLQDELELEALFCLTELHFTFVTSCAEHTVMELKVLVTWLLFYNFISMTVNSSSSSLFV